MKFSGRDQILYILVLIAIFLLSYQIFSPWLLSSRTLSIAQLPVEAVERIIIEPKSGSHNYSMIIIHGLGDSGAGWQPFAEFLQRDPAFANVKFILPSAPKAKVFAYGDQEVPSWFNIYRFGRVDTNNDHVGFTNSVGKIRHIISEEINTHGVQPDHIVVGGFSQGGAITLASAALLDIQIGGFVALSGFCSIEEYIKKQYSKANIDTPIFQAHGITDPVILYTSGQQSSVFYRDTVGFTNLTFKAYAGLAHATNPDEVADVVKFLKRVIVEEKEDTKEVKTEEVMKEDETEEKEEKKKKEDDDDNNAV